MKRFLLGVFLLAPPVSSLLADGERCLRPTPFEKLIGVEAHSVLIVTDVVPGGIAERAGIKPGDMIMSTGNRSIRDSVTWAEFRAKIREEALYHQATMKVRSGLPDADPSDRTVILRLANPEERFGFASFQSFYIEKVT